MTLHPRHHCFGAAVLGLAAALSSLSAQVEQASAAPTALDQVVVTATLTEKPLQEIPVAVSVVEGERVEQSNRLTLFAVASEVPALTFRTNSSNKDTSLFVRGIGTVTTSPGVEPSVSTVVDGVVLARPGQATLDLFDVERIEVLRGPQGTLFGKNATAGVVNVITRAPSPVKNGYLDASYFTGGNEYRLRAGVSGPLSEELRASLTLLYGKFDGNVTNLFDHSKVNDYEKTGARAKVEYDLSKQVSLTVAGDFLHSEDGIPAVPIAAALVAYPTGVVSEFPAYTAAVAPVVLGPKNREINSNYRTYVVDDNYGLSGTAVAQLDEHTLTSITAWRHWSNDQYQDGDRLPLVAAGLNQTHDKGTVRNDNVSEEVRLSSKGKRLVDYVGGLYYFYLKNDETYRRDLQRIVGGTAVSDSGYAVYGTKSTNYAAFGEATLHFTDTFHGLAGLRVSHDDLSFRHSRTSTSTVDLPGIRVNNGGSGSTSENGLSGRLGLQYDLRKNVHGYLTYARGYKGPAYNVFFNFRNEYDGIALDPETSDSFEAGLKTSTQDSRYIANLAVFSTTYDNFQANFQDVVLGSPVTRLVNAGSVYTRGVELDLSAKPTKELVLRGAAAFTRARVDSFRLPAGLTPAQIAGANIDGGRLPFSPDWKASLAGEYIVPLQQGYRLEFSTDYSWQSKVQYDLGQTPDTIQGGYGIWNAAVALLETRKGWRVSILVKNILDRSYAGFLTRGSNQLARIVPRDDRRFFGLNVHQSF